LGRFLILIATTYKSLGCRSMVEAGDAVLCLLTAVTSRFISESVTYRGPCGR